MRTAIAELGFVLSALVAGIATAALARLLAGDLAYLALFEPLILALAVSRQGSAPVGAIGWLSSLVQLRRSRFEATGWAGVIGVAFTLSGFAAAGDRYDPAATFVFAGIALAFVAGVPVLAVSHVLQLSESWRGVRHELLRAAEAADDGEAGESKGSGEAIPEGTSPTFTEEGVRPGRSRVDEGVTGSWETEVRLPAGLGRGLARALGLELPNEPPPSAAGWPDAAKTEAIVRARWERDRRAQDERMRANPLTSVEGWEALKRERAARTDRPDTGGSPRAAGPLDSGRPSARGAGADNPGHDPG